MLSTTGSESKYSRSFTKEEFATGEVASMIGEDVKLVRAHMRIPYDSGCIEHVGDKERSNIRMPIFRALVLPFIDVDGYRAMSIEERHDLNSAIGQGFFAEFMSSFRSKMIDTDEESHLVWDALDLDTRGKRELHDHLVAAYEGAKNTTDKKIAVAMISPV
jgi:hypothetical protein